MNTEQNVVENKKHIGRPKGSANKKGSYVAAKKQFNWYVAREHYEIVESKIKEKCSDLSVGTIITELIKRLINGEFHEELKDIIETQQECTIIVLGKKSRNYNVATRLCQEDIDKFHRIFKNYEPQDVAKILFYKILDDKIKVIPQKIEFVIK